MLGRGVYQGVALISTGPCPPGVMENQFSPGHSLKTISPLWATICYKEQEDTLMGSQGEEAFPMWAEIPVGVRGHGAPFHRISRDKGEGAAC